MRDLSKKLKLDHLLGDLKERHLKNNGTRSDIELKISQLLNRMKINHSTEHEAIPGFFVDFFIPNVKGI